MANEINGPAFDKMSKPAPWDVPPASICTALRLLLCFQIWRTMVSCLTRIGHITLRPRPMMSRRLPARPCSICPKV